MNLKERDSGNYFAHREQLGEIAFLGKPFMLEARSHIAQERLRSSSDEVFKPTRDQMRTYIHSKLFVPGSVQSQDLAAGQSWFYPADKTVVIWELLPERGATFTDPRENYLYRQLWTRYEEMLVRRFPGADQFLMAMEDEWGRDRWQGFATGMGYEQIQPEVFRKTIGPPFA